MAEYCKKQPSCTTPDGREWFASGGGNSTPDYIEREAAVNICSNQYKECLRKSDWCGDTVAWNIGFGIKQLPAADVAPVVHSHWVHDYSNVFKCFECLAMECMSPRNLRRYCPNCGARMDGE